MKSLSPFLCRHAPRKGNTDPLTDEGNQQAHMLGEAVRRSFPHGRYLGIGSQRVRTRETVAAILVGAATSAELLSGKRLPYKTLLSIQDGSRGKAPQPTQRSMSICT